MRSNKLISFLLKYLGTTLTFILGILKKFALNGKWGSIIKALYYASLFVESLFELFKS